VLVGRGVAMSCAPSLVGLGRTVYGPFRQLFLSGLLSVLGLLAATASATVIYQYTGPGFTNLDPPYTTSDHVSITLTASTLLPSNLPDQSYITPYLISFSFSDGVQTVSGATTPTNPLLFAATDDAGNIVPGWDVEVDQGGSRIISNYEPTFANGVDDSDSALANVDCKLVGVQRVCPQAFVSTAPAGQPAGTWVTIVPEPSTVALISGGASLLAATTRRGRCRDS
jgi:hypothetical protein